MSQTKPETSMFDRKSTAAADKLKLKQELQLKADLERYIVALNIM